MNGRHFFVHLNSSFVLLVKQYNFCLFHFSISLLVSVYVCSVPLSLFLSPPSVPNWCKQLDFISSRHSQYIPILSLTPL